MSKIDVIVPCYRYGHFLKQSVRSVLDQTGPEVRVLIIDDASPDDSAEIGRELARSERRVTFKEHAENRGHIATFNEGIEWTSSEYMLLLSADDYLLPGALCRAATLMDAHPEVSFTFGNAVILCEDGSTNEVDIPIAAAKAGETLILDGWEFVKCSGALNIVPTPTAVVRTELLKRLGGYRSNLPHSSDMELWLRLATHGSVGLIKSRQAVYRRHSNNMSLLYHGRRYLRDIEQRKLALEAFFCHVCTQGEYNSERWQETCRVLSQRVVQLANDAFTGDDPNLVEQCMALALQFCPDVARSWGWKKLRFKRCLGARSWRILRAAIGRQEGNLITKKETADVA